VRGRSFQNPRVSAQYAAAAPPHRILFLIKMDVQAREFLFVVEDGEGNRCEFLSGGCWVESVTADLK